MAKFRFGMVGTGFIAGVVAGGLARSDKATLSAVASRSLDRAKEFTDQHAGAPVEGWQALIARDDVDAVYVATPTMVKEEIALAAVDAGKHILVDKPFIDVASVKRMADAAEARGLVFMDATHFVHHPRTAAIKAAIPGKIGTPRSLHTKFYFPFEDKANIRFDPKQEPTGALGDLAWYSARAIVEYLQPKGAISTVTAVADRDPATGAVVRVITLLAFASGEVSTFDAGWTAGSLIMDLDLLGTTGVIEMDDFVLDVHDSLAFQNPDMPARYVHRTGVTTRKGFTEIAAPGRTGQHVSMVDDFADLAASGDKAARAAYVDASVKTQGILDAVWAKIG
ncbi:MAG: Gfo/Idh/MocA family protein [Alphaproteobacteria bacterium]